MAWSGPVFCLLLRVSSDYAQPITGQVTEVTCPVIGWAQPELTPSKRQKTGPDFGQFLLWPWPWIFKVKYGICYISAGNGLIARNEKQTFRLNSRPQIWPLGLTLAMTLTLNFQGQTWILLYLTPKWSDYHETQSKHIDWTLGLSNVTIGFDLGHDLDLEFSKSDMKSTIPQPKMVRLPRNEKQTYRSNTMPQMWPWNFDLGHDLEFSRSNMDLLYLRQKWSDCHKIKSKHLDCTLGPKCDH